MGVKFIRFMDSRVHNIFMNNSLNEMSTIKNTTNKMATISTLNSFLTNLIEVNESFIINLLKKLKALIKVIKIRERYKP